MTKLSADLEGSSKNGVAERIAFICGHLRLSVDKRIRRQTIKSRMSRAVPVSRELSVPLMFFTHL